MHDSDLLLQTTRLLGRLRAGDAGARNELFSVLYDELRELARGAVGQQPGGNTLQPTALVHEVWLRLSQNPDLDVDSRQHFVNIASRAMRNVLIDHARRRDAVKRRALSRSMPLDEALVAWRQDGTVDPLVLDEVLTRLEQRDARLAKIVELRFFAGLTIAEVAAAIGETGRQVQHAWTLARSWLAREIG